jgi:hypothetical protein
VKFPKNCYSKLVMDGLSFLIVPHIGLHVKSITRAYGRVDADDSRYLLGDHAGLLHLLVIAHEKEK